MIRNSVRLKQIIARSDFWVGLAFFLCGIAVLLEAREFPGAAARLPLLGGLLLTALGFALAVQASLVAPKTGLDRQLMKAIAFGPLPTAVLLLAWVYLASADFGFFEVGLPVVMGIVYLMGHRRLLLNALFSLAMVGAVFVAFGVILGVRFPVSTLLGN